MLNGHPQGHRSKTDSSALQASYRNQKNPDSFQMGKTIALFDVDGTLTVPRQAGSTSIWVSCVPTSVESDGGVTPDPRHAITSNVLERRLPTQQRSNSCKSSDRCAAALLASVFWVVLTGPPTHKRTPALPVQ